MKFENIKHAVNSIEMPDTMKDRIIENCYKKENRKLKQNNSIKWVSVVCVLGILFTIIPFINKNGEFQVANFAITAYAMSEDGTNLTANLSPETTVELSTKERINSLSSIGGDGANLIFADFILNVTGEHIDTITYTINNGKFIKDVTLTLEEYADRDWRLSEKIYFTNSEDNSTVFQGIKEIGSSYTVAYEEQDNYRYSLAIPHDGNDVIDDNIIISVNVKYTDGKSEQQDIVVEQKLDAISLRLK